MVNDFNSAMNSWNKLLSTYQDSIVRRKAVLGDGNGNVRVDGKPGWNWVRYEFASAKTSMVRNMVLGHLGEGTPVWVGKAEPQDDFEQVLGIYWGPYSWTITQAVLDRYATAPHGDTHHGYTGNDPAPIDLSNMINGKVVADNPESMSVAVQSFYYARGYSMEAFTGGIIDLSSYVPLVDGHRYTLVYMNIDDGSLGAVGGIISPDPMTPDIPDAPADTIPLGVINMYFGMTEIYDLPDIYQCKIMWGSIGGNTAIHTHTSDVSGGTSILGLEELMLACAEPIFMNGSMLVPTNAYHEVYIASMYDDAWPNLEADLTWIVPDNVYGCGQLLFLKVADPGMYTSYKITLRHGVGNLWFHEESDIVLDKGTDHVLLIYDGTNWCDVGGVGGRLRVSDYMLFSSYAGTSVLGALWRDSARKSLVANLAGIQQSMVGCIFTQTANKTVSNTTTETTLIGAGVGSVSLPANFFAIGKTIRITVRGLNSTATPAGTLTFRAKVGGTNVCVTPANTATNGLASRGWRIAVDITCRTIGAAGTVRAQGTVYRSTGAGTSATWMLTSTADTVVNTTGVLALNVTVQWGTASASNTISSTNMIVEVLN